MSAEATALPDHVLSAILTLAKRKLESPQFAFRGHDFQLQEVFSDLSQTGAYPILNAFVFASGGPEPYSPGLSESVSRLQLSGLIGRENPDYEVVFLQPAAEEFFNEVLQREFTPEQIDQLQRVASVFIERVKVVSRSA